MKTSCSSLNYDCELKVKAKATRALAKFNNFLFKSPADGSKHNYNNNLSKQNIIYSQVIVCRCYGAHVGIICEALA